MVGVPEGAGRFADATRQVVRDRGDGRVRLWNHDDPALDRLGCDWHFSARDHRSITDKLSAYLTTVPVRW